MCPWTKVNPSCQGPFFGKIDSQSSLCGRQFDTIGQGAAVIIASKALKHYCYFGIETLWFRTGLKLRVLDNISKLLVRAD